MNIGIAIYSSIQSSPSILPFSSTARTKVYKKAKPLAETTKLAFIFFSYTKIPFLGEASPVYYQGFEKDS